MPPASICVQVEDAKLKLRQETAGKEIHGSRVAGLRDNRSVQTRDEDRFSLLEPMTACLANTIVGEVRREARADKRAYGEEGEKGNATYAEGENRVDGWGCGKEKGQAAGKTPWQFDDLSDAARCAMGIRFSSPLN